MTLNLLISSILILIACCVFYFLKRSNKLRYLFIIFICCMCLFFLFNISVEIFLFLGKNSSEILALIEAYFINVSIINLSVILFVFSIVVLTFTHLKWREYHNYLKAPSKREIRGGSIKIGRTIKSSLRGSNYYLSIKDLEKHMFVCGSTGTGKSNFVQNFLIQFSKDYMVPFLLVEFKGEYHFLQEKLNDLLILWPGENFSINFFDPGFANPMVHAERIFDILKSSQLLGEFSEYTPQMEKVIIEILIKTCKSKDLQSWDGFEKVAQNYLTEKQDEIPMLKQTLIGVKNRIRRFSEGPLTAIFDPIHALSIEKVLNSRIILDLSSIIRLGGEKEDALFFLNIMLKYLWDINLSRGALNYKGIKHVTIIEDAQYFAPEGAMKKSKITNYLEDIALLQRGTGECLITLATRPSISKEILSNAGVCLIFKNHIEKEIICELMNLSEENKSILSDLEEGYCLIRVNSIKEPFIIKIPLIKRKTLTVSEILNKNKIIIDKLNSKMGDITIKNQFNKSWLSLSHLKLFKKFVVKLVVLRSKPPKLLHNFKEMELNLKKNNGTPLGNKFKQDEKLQILKEYINQLYKTQRRGKL